MPESLRPLDDIYIEWLYSHIGAVTNRNPSRSYWTLCGVLYREPFAYFVPNDDNRAADGVALREEFLEGVGRHIRDEDWLELECSILEMLIALAKRFDFQEDGGVENRFHEMLQNLELDHLTDQAFHERHLGVVRNKIRILNERTYGKNGKGGLFPLQNPDEDQREVEIWYQFQAYCMERIDTYW